jgi:hypothetical protein
VCACVGKGMEGKKEWGMAKVVPCKKLMLHAHNGPGK